MNGKIKGLSSFGVIAILLFIGAFFAYGSYSGWFSGLMPQQAQVPPGPSPGPQPQPEPEAVECLSTTSPTVTVKTPDVYGGAAVTTQNAYRECGQSSWTDIAGAGTFSADVGKKFEIVFGIDSNDDDAEPYGPHITCDAPYVVPCEENPAVERAVVDDSLATDLTAIAFDPDDGNQISASDTMTLGAGDIKNVRFKWQGAFEEDFGNRFVGEDSNVLVVRYNTTEIDKVYVTKEDGTKLTPANVPVLLSSSSGYTDRAYKFPVLESNAEYWHTLVIDADDSVNPGNSNVTLYLYDSNWYFDNDVTPSQVKPGVEDEDYGEIGATAPDSLEIAIS